MSYVITHMSFFKRLLTKLCNHDEKQAAEDDAREEVPVYGVVRQEMDGKARVRATKNIKQKTSLGYFIGPV